MHILWLGASTAVLGAGVALAASGMANADNDTGAQSPSRASAASHATNTGRAGDDSAPRTRPASRTALDTVSAAASVSRSNANRIAAAAEPLSVSEVPAVELEPRTVASRRPVPPAAPPAPAATTYTVANPLPPRLQWDANNGYCGETSFVSAGLHYGQYVSQYDARALASPGVPQNRASSQLLLGVNDVAAAKAMHLTAVPFNTATQTDTTSFLKWVKGKVAAGYPVAIGVYTNEQLFYGDTNPNAGDPQYDHIVTVTGVTSKQSLTGPVAYYSDDVITFSDNGLWTGTPTGLPQYTFNYPFGTFALSRRQANAARGPVYSLPSGGKNYGIAITGVADLNRETVPVRLTTSVNAENPVMVDGSNTRPAAKPVTLTVTLSKLTPGVAYNIYRYSSMAAVPESNFNANAAKATQKWKIVATGSTYTMSQTIMSNEIAVYRAVPVTAR